MLGKLLAPKEEEPPVRVTRSTTPKTGTERSVSNKPAIPRITSKGDVVAQLAKERETYLRRMQVCDRLREIALETGDQTLEKQAELLEDRARTIYQQRSAQLLANDADSDGVAIEATADTRALLIAGRPLGESIAQYGPFVMNTEQEIYQAVADYRAGRLAA